MKRRELEKALLVLETTPLLLKRIEGLSTADANRVRADGVSIRDRMWALALLEKDLWNRNLRLLLSEDEPRLAEAREPDVLARAARTDGDHREALRAFGVFRGQNVRLLRQVGGRQWDRAGFCGPDRPIFLRDVPGAMARSDERHQAKLLQAVPAPGSRRESRPAALVGFCA